LPPSDIADNLAAIRRRMDAAVAAAGRPAGCVQLVAVTKTFPPAAIVEAYRAGQRHFGENRVQEFEVKGRQLDLPDACWHLIGHLQSNKAGRAAQLFDVIHTIDSIPLAERLNRLVNRPAPLPVFIEVKLSAEATKSGATEDQVEPLADAVRKLERLELRGLMTMPPWSTDPEVARPYFRRLREIAARLGVTELSMGMTNDFEVAIQEGATIVRVGTAIFGKRVKQPPEESAEQAA
jgi:pyridoxal phosphate enzyme (YggS family)